MPEEPQPDPVPADEPLPHPAEPLQIDTPVIDVQGLRHKAAAHARGPNKGTRSEPKIDSADARDFAREDEEALDAIEKFEKSLNRQLPG